MSGGLSPDDLRRWAEHATGSPLYRRLIEVIAADPELLRILNEIEHTPRPNVLFAGVHYLLMREPTQELARFYPNLTGASAPVEEADTPFREFVLKREPELLEIGRTRHTQTNEIRRCAALLPAIWETAVTRFHLVDIGTSAGLNLLIDRYHYRWGGIEWGPPSSVTLECQLRGRPPSPRPIEVLSRTGLDMNPLDITDRDSRMWLQALIWPEQGDRRRRLQAALDSYPGGDVDLVEGDAVDTLGPALERLPDSGPVVVMHSFAVNQLRPDQREAIDETLSRARERRTIWRVSMELLEWSDEAPKLSIDGGSGLAEIGQAQPHGEWLELFQVPRGTV